MSSFFKKQFLLFYALCVLGDLIATVTENFWLNLVFKPLIVSSLLLFLFNQTRVKGASFALGGLVLSLLGDCLLIFQDLNGLFFIGGLLSFLVAHLLYIVYYLKSAAAASSKTLRLKPLLLVLFGVYGLLFCYVLYPNLGALRVPVVAYASVLLSMNIFALNRYGKVSHDNFKGVMTGALFFTASDSLLAINKFVHPLPLAGIVIMSTYAIAQYLIARSTLPAKTA